MEDNFVSEEACVIPKQISPYSMQGQSWIWISDLVNDKTSKDKRPCVELQDTSSFTKGRELFRDGLLTEAMLAFEAEAQRNPNNVEAWRMLGTVQAENDDDLQVSNKLLCQGLITPAEAASLPDGSLR